MMLVKHFCLCYIQCISSLQLFTVSPLIDSVSRGRGRSSVSLLTCYSVNVLPSLSLFQRLAVVFHSVYALLPPRRTCSGGWECFHG